MMEAFVSLKKSFIDVSNILVLVRHNNIITAIAASHKALPILFPNLEEVRGINDLRSRSWGNDSPKVGIKSCV